MASLCLEFCGSLLFYPLGNEGIMSKIYNYENVGRKWWLGGGG